MSVDSAHNFSSSKKTDESTRRKNVEYGSDQLLRSEEARQKTWRTIQTQIKERLGLQKFGLWFKQTVLMNLDDDELVVGVPNVIVKQYLEQKYRTIVQDTAEELLGDGLEVRFDVAPKLLRKMRKKKRGESQDEHDVSEIAEAETETKKKKSKSRKEKQAPKHTFEKLVLTDSNRLPFLAAREIASRRDAQFKFLLVMGEHGVGKTALLRAACNEAINSSACQKVHYCRGEKWCNEFYHALQTKRTRQFRNRHRKWDLLLLDGVHFLEGKPAAQEELLHTVKTIQESGGRLVFSTYGHPHDLQESKPAFKHLISGAFWVELRTPPQSERMEVACQLASNLNLKAEEGVFEFLACEYGSSVRELEAAVSSLSAAASLQGMDGVGLHTARQLLGRVRSTRPRKAPDIGDICEAVIDVFGVSDKELTGRSRCRAACRSRQAAMYLARKTTDLSLSDIGRHFGNRTHSTVKHSVEQAKDMRNDDSQFRDNLQSVREMLGV